MSNVSEEAVYPMQPPMTFLSTTITIELIATTTKHSEAHDNLYLLFAKAFHSRVYKPDHNTLRIKEKKSRPLYSIFILFIKKRVSSRIQLLPGV